MTYHSPFCPICGQEHDTTACPSPLPIGQVEEFPPYKGIVMVKPVRAVTDVDAGELVVEMDVASLSELQRLQQESKDLRRAMELIDKYERLLWIRALIGFQLGFLVGVLLYWMLS